MNLSKYKHIIWDWNGTILDDIDMCIAIINELLVEYKLPGITAHKYKDVFTIPVENYYKAIGFDFQLKSFEVVGKEWMDEYEKRKYSDAQIHPDVNKLINRIHQNGQSQSILSAYIFLIVPSSAFSGFVAPINFLKSSTAFSFSNAIGTHGPLVMYSNKSLKKGLSL